MTTDSETKYVANDGKHSVLKSLRFWVAISFGSGLWLGLLAFFLMTNGWHAVEKTLKQFAMPLGPIWSLLLGFGFFAFIRTQRVDLPP